VLQGAGAAAAVSQSLVASVVITAANVLASIVTARYLGASGRGELAALTTLPTFLSFVTTFGLPSGLIFHARRSPERLGSLVSGVFVLSVTAGVAGALVGYVVAPYVLAGFASDSLAVARALLAFTLVGSLTNAVIPALLSRHEFSRCNAVRIAQPTLSLIGMLALGMLGWMTPLTGALVVSLSSLPGLIWGFAWIHRECKPVWRGWLAAAREVRSYSLRAYSGELLSSLATQVDKVIVVGIFAPALMGLYVVAMSLSRLVAIFAAAIVTVLFPKVSGRPQREVIDVTSRAAGATTLLVGLTAVALIALGPALLRVLYGAEFEGAALAFRLLVLEAAVASVVQVLSQAFMALDRPGLVTLQYGSGAVVAVPLLFLLAPAWGIEGAAAALLIASAVRLACTYWCFKGVMKIDAPRVLGQIGPSVSLLKTAVRAALR